MTLNPELRRNLWLQLSVHRLIAMPAVLGIVFGATLVATRGSGISLGIVASWGFMLLALVWGTRRAAEAVAEEVNGGTWDSQRMSSLGAWTMTWGKLLGSTVYPWYGALICLAVYVVARSGYAVAPLVALEAGLMLEAALIGQTAAMAASLVMWRKQDGRRHPRWAAAQAIGVAAGLTAASKAGIAFGTEFVPVVGWYGLALAAKPFWLASLGLWFGWLVLGAYRLMRQELLYRTWPWAWVGFVLFVMAYLGGFAYGRGGAAWLWSFAATGLALFYASLFGEPKRIARYRIFLATAVAGDLRRSLAAMPLWLPTYLLTVAAAVLALASGSGGLPLPDVPPEVAAMVPLSADVASAVPPLLVVAVLLFALRDAGLVLALNFTPRAARADLSAFLYLALAYGPLAWLALRTEQRWLVAFLLPVPGTDPLPALAPVLLELVLVAIFLWYRWRRYAVPGAVRRTRAAVEAAGAAR